MLLANWLINVQWLQVHCVAWASFTVVCIDVIASTPTSEKNKHFLERIKKQKWKLHFKFLYIVYWKFKEHRQRLATTIQRIQIFQSYDNIDEGLKRIKYLDILSFLRRLPKLRSCSIATPFPRLMFLLLQVTYPWNAFNKIIIFNTISGDNFQSFTALLYGQASYSTKFNHTLSGNISEVAMNINKWRSDNALRKLLRGCLFKYWANVWKS